MLLKIHHETRATFQHIINTSTNLRVPQIECYLNTAEYLVVTWGKVPALTQSIECLQDDQTLLRDLGSAGAPDE